MSVKRPSVQLKADEISFTDAEIADFRAVFKEFDQDGNGSITTDELGTVFQKLGESVPGYQLRDMIAEVDTDNSKTVEFNEFVEMMKKVRASGGKVGGAFSKVVQRVEKVTKLGGTSAASAAETTHSFSEEETAAFTDWINFTLAKDADLKSKLPIPAGDVNALFVACKDGILLCKLINSSVEGTIDERAINKTKLTTFTATENLTLALNSAMAIGCNVVNIGASDIAAGTQHLVLGLLWQIIRIGLFAKINIQSCPGLSRLLEGDETLADLLALAPDQLLLRWVNYHLKESGNPLRIRNFSGDIKDSEAYVFLLKQIAPPEFGITTAAMGTSDPTARAERMLADAERMECRKFVTANDVVKGNAKLNLAFVANLFNTYPGLLPNDAAIADFDMAQMDETREERTFRNWMNSLGVNPFVNHLYNDLTDGTILLQLFDAVQPGIVDWARVNKPPFKKMGSNMKKIENLNYAIDLGKQLNFSTVGIGGKDIFDGIKTLTLAVVWQLMRAYTLSVLQKISGDKRLADPQIIKWANDTLSDAGKSTRIRSFKDDEISTSVVVIDLIDAIKPGAIDYALVTAADTEENKLLNAKYAISIARKIGARVYALPEDLVEVKQKMVMTIFACLMARALGKK